jgi:hypothetical protein
VGDLVDVAVDTCFAYLATISSVFVAKGMPLPKGPGSGAVGWAVSSRSAGT